MRDAPPHLSVVAVSRNDDHGGDMLGRMQHFVNGFIAQCRRHDLRAELILVEWNPPADRPPLAEALSWPADFGPAEVRIVTVPRDVHATFEHADKLPLYQMIGKNVGIRRARGAYVLATNVDILFNDKLVRYLRDRLKPGTVLRVDRFDVPKDVPVGVPFESVQAYCDKSFYHVATRFGIYDAASGVMLCWRNPIMRWFLGNRYRAQLNTPKGRLGLLTWLVPAFVALAPRIGKLGGLVTKLRPPEKIPIRLYRLTLLFAHAAVYGLRAATRLGVMAFAYPFRKRNFSARLAARTAELHTYACGDFTLMAGGDWFRLRGYAEWPMYSWHLDSVMMYGAAVNGIRQIALDQRYRIYHMEQAPGSGWSPNAGDRLFARLDAANIPYLTNEMLEDCRRQFIRAPSTAIINGDGWGLAKARLLESRIGAGGINLGAAARHEDMGQSSPIAPIWSDAR